VHQVRIRRHRRLDRDFPRFGVLQTPAGDRSEPSCARLLQRLAAPIVNLRAILREGCRGWSGLVAGTSQASQGKNS
jgi:hypothetical protein